MEQESQWSWGQKINIYHKSALESQWSQRVNGAGDKKLSFRISEPQRVNGARESMELGTKIEFHHK